MATLIRPKLWGQQKPRLGASINWGHPLAQGISRAWLFGDLNNTGGPNDVSHTISLDLVRGDAMSTPRTAGTAGIQSPIGSAYQTAADGTPVSFGSQLKSGLGADSVTIAVYWGTTPGAANPNYCGGLYCTRDVATDVSPTLTFSDGHNPGLLFIADGSSLAVGAQVSTAAWSPVAGKWYQTVGVYDRGGSGGPNSSTGSFGLYTNGVLAAANNYALAGTFNGTFTSNTVGGAAGFDSENNNNPAAPHCYTFNADRRVAYIYVWKRALSQSEIRWLYGEPYAFVAPPAPAQRWSTAPIVIPPPPPPPVETSHGGGGRPQQDWRDTPEERDLEALLALGAL